MADGNGKSALEYALKAIFGEAPAQWIRFVLLGAGLMFLYHSAINFRDDIKAEGMAVRSALAEYVASNKRWQELSDEERKRLIAKADRRFLRLYAKNGWTYEGLTE